jgi:hypothetical protein
LLLSVDDDGHDMGNPGRGTMIAAALGWLGTAGTFGAYLMLCRGRVSATSLRYALLNTVGGVLAGAGGVLYGAWPSVVANAVWAALGAHTIVTTLLERRRTARAVPDRDPDPLPPPVELAPLRARRQRATTERESLAA